MKLTLLLLFVFFSLLSNSQMLDNSKGETFSDKPFFNTEFIKKNKIKSIKGYYSSKAELSDIKKNNNIYVYQFNVKGELTKEYSTKNRDTIVNEYKYDTYGSLIESRKSDKYGFHSYLFKYDSLHRIISKEYRKDLSKTADRINFDLKKTIYISKESYSYENTTIGLKKLYYNNKNKLFKTEFFYKDKDGFLLKQDYQLKTGSGRGLTTYSYGNKGLIIEKHKETYLINKTTTTLKFEYDEYENVLAQHYYRNKEYLTEYQIIYDDKTMLLSAILTRDVKINFITILKLSDYTFYDIGDIKL